MRLVKHRHARRVQKETLTPKMIKARPRRVSPSSGLASESQACSVSGNTLCGDTSVRGLYVSTGMSGHGLTFAPGEKRGHFT
jgi:glycine/D-amino acid oxidase-like deaminating enzyme